MAALDNKLLSFGANGISIFQGTRKVVTKKLVDHYAQFMIGNHDVAHQMNLAAKALMDLSIFQSIDVDVA